MLDSASFYIQTRLVWTARLKGFLSYSCWSEVEHDHRGKQKQNELELTVARTGLCSHAEKP